MNLCPTGDPNRSDTLNDLAIAVSTRFEQLGGMENLEESITYHRQALALRPHGHPDRPSSLDNLAYAMSTRFQQFGRMENLEEAITCHRQALAVLPPDCSYPRHNLAIAVFTRFKQLGRMEEAITCHLQALVLGPHGHPHRPHSLHNLSHTVSNTDIHIVHIFSMTSRIPCPLDSGSWEE